MQFIKTDDDIDDDDDDDDDKCIVNLQQTHTRIPYSKINFNFYIDYIFMLFC